MLPVRHWKNCRVLWIQRGEHCSIFQAEAEESKSQTTEIFNLCIMENRWETGYLMIPDDTAGAK